MATAFSSNTISFQTCSESFSATLYVNQLDNNRLSGQKVDRKGFARLSEHVQAIDFDMINRGNAGFLLSDQVNKAECSNMYLCMYKQVGNRMFKVIQQNNKFSEEGNALRIALNNTHTTHYPS